MGNWGGWSGDVNKKEKGLGDIEGLGLWGGRAYGARFGKSDLREKRRGRGFFFRWGWEIISMFCLYEMVWRGTWTSWSAELGLCAWI